MKTMSVRGTITSRTMVSPSSNTEWIIIRSPASMSWLLLGEVDQLAQLRLGRERSLAQALARGDRVADEDQQPAASGPSTLASGWTSRAAASAIGPGCWRPRVRGETPMAM